MKTRVTLAEELEFAALPPEVKLLAIRVVAARVAGWHVNLSEQIARLTDEFVHRGGLSYAADVSRPSLAYCIPCGREHPANRCRADGTDRNADQSVRGDQA